MVTNNKTETVKKYMKEISEGKLYKGKSKKSVVWMKEDKDTFIAYQFINVHNEDISKEKPDYKKYCITDDKEKISCYKIECNANEVIISENPNLAKNREFGINANEVLIEYPCKPKEVNIDDIPKDIMEELNEWVYNLQAIGFAEHFDKEDVIKII